MSVILIHGYRLLLTVLVNLLNHLLEDFAVEGLSHQSEDFADRFRRDAASLFAVEAVEGLLQDCGG